VKAISVELYKILIEAYFFILEKVEASTAAADKKDAIAEVVDLAPSNIRYIRVDVVFKTRAQVD